MGNIICQLFRVPRVPGKLGLYIMKLHNLADKYGCMDFQNALATVYPLPPEFYTDAISVGMSKNQMKALLECHYDACFDDECKVGEALVQELLRFHPKIMKEHGANLVKKYPRLGRDIVFITAKMSNGDAHKWLPEKCTCRHNMCPRA